MLNDLDLGAVLVVVRARDLSAFLAGLDHLGHAPVGALADLVGGGDRLSAAPMLFWLSTSYLSAAFLAALRAAASAIASGVFNHFGRTGLAVGSGLVTVAWPLPLLRLALLAWPLAWG